MNKLTPLPKISLATLRKSLLLLVFSLLLFTCGFYYAGGRVGTDSQNPANITIERTIPENQKDVDFSLFWSVWDTLDQSYFDKSKLNRVEMVYGAIKGMVAAVGDPYTVFLPPSENKIVQEDLQGSFSGIGIQIGFRGTQLAVIAPLPSSPAEKAGIKAGDYIVVIKDEAKNTEVATSGMSLPDAVSMIRGPKGTKIALTLLRDEVDEPLIIDVVRDEISVPSVILEFIGSENEIAHINLLKFVEETNGEWDKTVRDILTSNAKYIVLDLRNNPGGYLQGSVDIAGEFLNSGTLVVIEESAKGVRNEFKTDKLPKLNKYKMVILVNKGSASASEILASALKEQIGIKIIGETSFGKGTIQEPRQINSGAGLHITTAKWLTPEGNWVNEKGITPDEVVSDNPETNEDEQLDKAIEIVKNI